MDGRRILWLNAPHAGSVLHRVKPVLTKDHLPFLSLSEFRTRT